MNYPNIHNAFLRYVFLRCSVLQTFAELCLPEFAWEIHLVTFIEYFLLFFRQNVSIYAPLLLADCMI